MEDAEFLPKHLNTGEQSAEFFRDWGIFFAKKSQHKLAVPFFDKSLNLKPDPNAYFNRSIVKSVIGDIQGALDDVIDARNLNNLKAYCIAECNGLFELNEFEQAKAQLHLYKHHFEKLGAQTDSFENKLCIIRSTYADCLSEHIGPYLLRNTTRMNEILEYLHNRNFVETRPLWKVLKEQEKCDVLSVLEKENLQEKLSPIEIARKARSFQIRAQTYFPRAWRDIVFIRNLKNDKNFQKQHPIFHKDVSDEYKNVQRFMEMLHIRNPLYNINGEKKGMAIWHDLHYKFLKRVQYQTRRDMFKILRELHKLRAQNKIQKMRTFIDEITGNWATVKTFRIMPWKHEFLADVYNLLALTLLASYKVPENIGNVAQEYRLHALLGLPVSLTTSKSYVFGVRSVNLENIEATTAYKEKVARFEKRLRFSQFTIEKCYLHYELAHMHIENGHCGDATTSAYKAIKAATKIFNIVWEILSLLLIIKAHTIMDKFTHERKVLLIIRSMAKKLNNKQAIDFVNSCLEASDLRRSHVELERKSLFSRRSDFSITSFMQLKLDDDDDDR